MMTQHPFARELLHWSERVIVALFVLIALGVGFAAFVAAGSPSVPANDSSVRLLHIAGDVADGASLPVVSLGLNG